MAAIWGAGGTLIPPSIIDAPQGSCAPNRRLVTKGVTNVPNRQILGRGLVCGGGDRTLLGIRRPVTAGPL